MQMLIVLIFWLIFGSIASYLAKGRGRDPVAWFFLGVGLQLIALIILYMLPPLNKSDHDASLELNEDQQMAEFEFPDPAKDLYVKEWFFVNSDRLAQGPFSFDEMQQKWADGFMGRQTYVWSEGMVDWRRIDNFPVFESSVGSLALERG